MNRPSRQREPRSSEFIVRQRASYRLVGQHQRLELYREDPCLIIDAKQLAHVISSLESLAGE